MADLGELVDYNAIPVKYCPKCLSLKIMRVLGMEGLDYCDKCGCTSMEETSIEEWEKMHILRYGFRYLDNKLCSK